MATDYFKEFSEYMVYELNRSPLTTNAYILDLNFFREYLLNEKGEFDPTKATHDDVRRWISVQSARGLSNLTMRRKLQSMRTFYRFLQRRGYVKENPTLDIDLGAKPQKLPAIVPDAQMRKVLEKIEEEPYSIRRVRNRCILEILYCLGLRRQEIVDLNDKDIDFERLEMRVTGKRDKVRVMPLSQELADHLKEYIDLRNKQIPGRSGGALFVGRHGDRIKVGSIQSVVNTALSNANLGKRGPHVLRHSFATTMLEEGSDLSSLRELLGHAKMSTTQKYTHLSGKDVRESYDNAHPRAKQKK